MKSKEKIKEFLETLNKKDISLKEEYQKRFLEFKENGINNKYLDVDKKEMLTVQSYIEILEWVLNEETSNYYEKERE